MLVHSLPASGSAIRSGNRRGRPPLRSVGCQREWSGPSSFSWRQLSFDPPSSASSPTHAIFASSAGGRLRKFSDFLVRIRGAARAVGTALHIHCFSAYSPDSLLFEPARAERFEA